MDDNDIERLKNISNRLRSKIIGQDQAVEMVSRAIRRNRAGFDDGNRPLVVSYLSALLVLVKQSLLNN